MQATLKKPRSTRPNKPSSTDPDPLFDDTEPAPVESRAPKRQSAPSAKRASKKPAAETPQTPDSDAKKPAAETPKTGTKCLSQEDSESFSEHEKFSDKVPLRLRPKKNFSEKEKNDPNVTVVRAEDVAEVVPSSPEEDAMRVRVSLPPGPRPLLPSEKNPALRGPNWCPPTEPKDWLPTWKPRKRPLLGDKNANVQKIVREIEDRLMMADGEFSKIPVGPDGVLVPSMELFTAIIWWVEQGGTLGRFAEAVGAPRPTLQAWINQRPDVKARYKEAEARSADALVERAQEMAQTPFVVEETYVSYDGEGKLLRKDVTRRDAVLARKLFVQQAQWLAAKRAPERYGEKVEVKTDDAMAVSIVAARRRLMQGS